MNSPFPDHPTLLDYNLENFDGISLYNEEIKHILKENGPQYDQKFQTLTWKNQNNQNHRDNAPAIITKTGDFWWMQNGLQHRITKPSMISISTKTIRWSLKGQRHRIGGFAYFDQNRNVYNLYIEDMIFHAPDRYVQEAKKWLLKNESAHSCIEQFTMLDEAYKLGYLYSQNWKDGIFIG